MDDSSELTRRRLLATAALTTGVGLGGCLDGDDEAFDPDGDEETADDRAVSEAPDEDDTNPPLSLLPDPAVLDLEGFIASSTAGEALEPESPYADAFDRDPDDIFSTTYDIVTAEIETLGLDRDSVEHGYSLELPNGATVSIFLGSFEVSADVLTEAMAGSGDGTDERTHRGYDLRTTEREGVAIDEAGTAVLSATRFQDLSPDTVLEALIDAEAGDEARAVDTDPVAGPLADRTEPMWIAIPPIEEIPAPIAVTARSDGDEIVYAVQATDVSDESVVDEYVEEFAETGLWIGPDGWERSASGTTVRYSDTVDPEEPPVSAEPKGPSASVELERDADTVEVGLQVASRLDSWAVACGDVDVDALFDGGETELEPIPGKIVTSEDEAFAGTCSSDESAVVYGQYEGEIEVLIEE